MVVIKQRRVVMMGLWKETLQKLPPTWMDNSLNATESWDAGRGVRIQVSLSHDDFFDCSGEQSSERQFNDHRGWNPDATKIDG